MIRRCPLAAWLVGLTLFAGQTLAEPAPAGFSAAGLYNLANAYARAGKPGMAVLNYERARLLAPNDPDIEANLNYVLEASRLPSDVPNAFARALRAAAPTVAAWIGLMGLLLAGTSLLAGRLSSRHRWLRRAGAALGFVLLGLTLGNVVVLWPKLHEAVVISCYRRPRPSASRPSTRVLCWYGLGQGGRDGYRGQISHRSCRGHRTELSSQRFIHASTVAYHSTEFCGLSTQ
jgi:hypothetical protein